MAWSNPLFLCFRSLLCLFLLKASYVAIYYYSQNEPKSLQCTYVLGLTVLVVFQESEWLRVTLHKWLDEEYCPEETNVEISKVAAQSYYRSLLDKQTDLGEILLKMVRELETISYQESFHGAFSSANAAINLIAQRIEDSSHSP